MHLRIKYTNWWHSTGKWGNGWSTVGGKFVCNQVIGSDCSEPSPNPVWNLRPFSHFPLGQDCLYHCFLHDPAPTPGHEFVLTGKRLPWLWTGFSMHTHTHPRPRVQGCYDQHSKVGRKMVRAWRRAAIPFPSLFLHLRLLPFFWGRRSRRRRCVYTFFFLSIPPHTWKLSPERARLLVTAPLTSNTGSQSTFPQPLAGLGLDKNIGQMSEKGNTRASYALYAYFCLTLWWHHSHTHTHTQTHAYINTPHKFASVLLLLWHTQTRWPPRGWGTEKLVSWCSPLVYERFSFFHPAFPRHPQNRRVKVWKFTPPRDGKR